MVAYLSRRLLDAFVAGRLSSYELAQSIFGIPKTASSEVQECTG